MRKLWLWLEVRRLRFRLDEDLAEGRPPDADELHALRARQLVSPGVRHRLATTLLTIADIAEDPPKRNVAVPPARGAVVESRALLIQLAQRLDARGPLEPRGVAMVNRLLSDGSGPLYFTGEGPFGHGWGENALWQELRIALQALDRSSALY